MRSVTVPVASVGVPPTGSRPPPHHRRVRRFGGKLFFGGTPKTAGETPALPHSNWIVPA